MLQHKGVHLPTQALKALLVTRAQVPRLFTTSGLLNMLRLLLLDPTQTLVLTVSPLHTLPACLVPPSPTTLSYSPFHACLPACSLHLFLSCSSACPLPPQMPCHRSPSALPHCRGIAHLPCPLLLVTAIQLPLPNYGLPCLSLHPGLRSDDTRGGPYRCPAFAVTHRSPSVQLSPCDCLSIPAQL